MDNTIRKNEICVIGLPRCDYVFSSTRSCFIAYGFESSPLEVDILTSLLKEKGMVVEQAGGSLTPAESAFCAKICSKIICAQFCVVLLNHDEKNGQKVPNANVNMEYGLMLGFNKYVIPFQREGEPLPFNVSGLDTVKYNSSDFRSKAAAAIDQAITHTTQEDVQTRDPDQVLNLFLMERSMIVAPLSNEDEKAIYRFGNSLGFMLLHSFSGEDYVFFGAFTSLRAESVLWRILKLYSVITGRRSSLPRRLEKGIITKEQFMNAEDLFEHFSILVVVATDSDKNIIQKELDIHGQSCPTEIITVDEAGNEISDAVSGEIS